MLGHLLLKLCYLTTQHNIYIIAPSVLDMSKVSYLTIQHLYSRTKHARCEGCVKSLLLNMVLKYRNNLFDEEKFEGP